MTTPRPARILVAATVASLAIVGLAATPADAASKLQITRVYVNSPGADRGGNTSLNAEYVRLKNTGSSALSLKGYTLRDESNHVYRFGSFTLKGGKTVTVRTGTGTDTGSTRYMNSGWYVWNNSGGDSATVKTAGGTKVDSCSWKTVSSYKDC